MTKTDVVYDLVEHMEKEKRWMTLVAIVCLIIAPLGLWINLKAIEIIIMRADRLSWLSMRFIFLSLNVVISAMLVYVGMRQALFLSRWKKKLALVREHERKVYREVMGESL